MGATDTKQGLRNKEIQGVGVWSCHGLFAFEKRQMAYWRAKTGRHRLLQDTSHGESRLPRICLYNRTCTRRGWPEFQTGTCIQAIGKSCSSTSSDAKGVDEGEEAISRWAVKSM